MNAPISPQVPAWGYDRARWKQGVRKGRERGCWVYIARDELESAGIPTDAPPPWYKLSGAQSRKSSHRVIVSLKPEQP